MKNIFKNLFSIKNFVSLDYFFDDQKGLISTANNCKKKKLAKLCVIDRSDFWHAKRSYQARITDLPKILKAEIDTIAPFDGHVFWKINKLGLAESEVSYIVVPKAYIDLIKKECRFIFPLNVEQNKTLLESEEALETTANELSYSNDIEKVEIWDLIGFFISQEKKTIKQKQKLSTKQLGLFLFVCISIFTLVSCVYLNFTLSNYEKSIAENKQAVEDALQIQREVKSQYQSKLELEKFTSDNANVLAIFSSFEFAELDYVITRIHLHPKGVKLTGSSISSATELLTAIVNNKNVKEAKFARPVTKNRFQEEDFTIEVVFI